LRYTNSIIIIIIIIIVGVPSPASRLNHTKLGRTVFTTLGCSRASQSKRRCSLCDPSVV